MRRVVFVEKFIIKNSRAPSSFANSLWKEEKKQLAKKKKGWEEVTLLLCRLGRRCNGGFDGVGFYKTESFLFVLLKLTHGVYSRMIA